MVEDNVMYFQVLNRHPRKLLKANEPAFVRMRKPTRVWGFCTQVQALMFVTPPLQGGVLKRPVAYAVTEFCLAESKAV
jgi:hypothetical protein